MIVDQARAAGPVLLLDSGNALLKTPAASEPKARERAELVLRTMGQLGTFAMAAGARDLGLGLEFLKSGAAAAKVQVLSANLVDDKGKALFPASAVATVGGLKVGVVGLSPVGALAPGVKGSPPVGAALKEVKRLKGKADVVVILAAVPYADALELAKVSQGGIDFVLQSHEGRGPGLAQKMEGAIVVPSGERGRQVGRLDLSFAGSRDWVDAGSAERDRETAAFLDGQIERTRQRLLAEKDPSSKVGLTRALETLEKRKAELAAASPVKDGSRFALTFATLGPEVKDDPGLKALVDRLEPPGSHAH